VGKRSRAGRERAFEAYLPCVEFPGGTEEFEGVGPLGESEFAAERPGEVGGEQDLKGAAKGSSPKGELPVGGRERDCVERWDDPGVPGRPG